MPCYEFKCPACGREEDRIVRMAARDEQICDTRIILNADIREASFGPDGSAGLSGTIRDSKFCGAKLERIEIPSAQTNLVDKLWGYKAILGDGRRVPGSFGLGHSRNHKGFM